MERRAVQWGSRLLVGAAVVGVFGAGSPARSPAADTGYPELRAPDRTPLSAADSLDLLGLLRRRIRENRLDVRARAELADLLTPSEDVELRREAMKALDQAVRIDGSDPDLWIRVARLQERRGFKGEAKSAFRRALIMAPDRADLWDDLAEHDFLQFQKTDRISLLQEAFGANGRALALDPGLVRALRRGVRLAAIEGDSVALDSLLACWEKAAPDAPWPTLVRGMLDVEAGAWTLAQESFDRGIAGLPDRDRLDFSRLDRVDPLAEEARKKAREPRRYFDDYWRWRDPTPADPVNPRLLEHYRRMVEAELLFGLDDQQVRGWDHAPGEMIVHYGLPAGWSYERDVIRARTYQVWGGLSAPAIEVLYGRRDSPLSFEFVDYNLSGRYFNPIEAFPRDEDLMLVSDPVLYQPPFASPELPQVMELWRFVDGEGKGRTEVAVALDPDSWPKDVLAQPHRLACQIALYDQHWNLEDAAVGSWAPFTTDALGRLVGIFEMKGSADSAIVGLQTTDREKKGRAAGYAELPPLDTYGAPILSDIAFLSQVSFDGKHPEYRRAYGSGLPDPGHLYPAGDPIGIGFAAYGLRPGKDGVARARISVTVGRDTPRGWLAVMLLKGGKEPEAELVFNASQPGTTIEQVLSLDIPPLEPGTYVLRVRVEDLVSGTSAERRGPFTVVGAGKRR